MRLENELKTLAPDDTEVRVISHIEGVDSSHMAFVGMHSIGCSR